LGKSEYFYDEEGVIYRRRMNGEHHQFLVPRILAKEVIEVITIQFMRHIQDERGPWKFYAYVTTGPR
jgi:hypothetical protein